MRVDEQRHVLPGVGGKEPQEAHKAGDVAPGGRHSARLAEAVRDQQLDGLLSDVAFHHHANYPPLCQPVKQSRQRLSFLPSISNNSTLRRQNRAILL